jgi:hypothetical protein
MFKNQGQATPPAGLGAAQAPNMLLPQSARPAGRGMAALKGGPRLKKMDILPPELIESKILSIREKKVMLDQTLANLYQVETKVLNQAVTDKMIEEILTQKRVSG